MAIVSGPRTWSKVGSAAAGSVALSCPFRPSTLYIENGDGTNAFNLNWYEDSATVTDNSTNFRVSAGSKIAVNFGNPNAQGPFVINIIAIAGTPAYVINGVGAR